VNRCNEMLRNKMLRGLQKDSESLNRFAAPSDPLKLGIPITLTRSNKPWTCIRYQERWILVRYQESRTFGWRCLPFMQPFRDSFCFNEWILESTGRLLANLNRANKKKEKRDGIDKKDIEKRSRYVEIWV
jgi:hypothetical protein